MQIIDFENTYADRLPGFFVSGSPAEASSPVLLQFNRGLADELGLNTTELDSERLAGIFSGNELPAGTQPLAQAYAGHQFGHFVPQLGDGRALLLGEVVDRHGKRRDIALKGSGPTAFARGGDGNAAIGPVLREYSMGEAMHALGVPTTRALAAVGTGEVVRREQPLPGAVLTRVAASHIRVGTFQFFAARRRFDQVRMLADYVIERHDPHLADDSERYLLLLRSVAERQATLIAKWMLVGFIHGVMNTDNMAISGETIDYGPCAFVESYRPSAVFSSIDTVGRYALGNQPAIARWNLARLAETLLPLIDEHDLDRAESKAMEVINDFPSIYEMRWLSGVRAKLGLEAMAGNDEKDRSLAQDWLELLEQHHVDFTLGWRRLVDVVEGRPESLKALFPSPDAVDSWLERWRQRLDLQQSSEIATTMRAANPIYIPRNHLVEEALVAASDHADLAPFERLLDVITHPFEERAGLERYAQPAPREFTDCYKTFCGT
nr:YdiU family protein [Thalassoroseus pseudoceratinae]